MEILENFGWRFFTIIGVYAISIGARAIFIRTYNTYCAISIQSKMTGHEAASLILSRNHIYNVYVYPMPGVLTDSYHRRSGSIALSEKNYDGSSVAAVAVAAHEASHAIQVKEKYTPMTALVVIKPLVKFVSYLFIPLFVMSTLANFTISTDILLYVYIGIFVLQLITLPVEYNASNRALCELRELGILNDTEVYGARRMLRAAALTYVASVLITFILTMRGRKK